MALQLGLSMKEAMLYEVGLVIDVINERAKSNEQGSKRGTNYNG